MWWWKRGPRELDQRRDAPQKPGPGLRTPNPSPCRDFRVWAKGQGLGGCQAAGLKVRRTYLLTGTDCLCKLRRSVWENCRLSPAACVSLSLQDPKNKRFNSLPAGLVHLERTGSSHRLGTPEVPPRNSRRGTPEARTVELPGPSSSQPSLKPSSAFHSRLLFSRLPVPSFFEPFLFFLL